MSDTSLNTPSSILVQCSRSLVSVCHKEIKGLGFEPDRKDRAGVWLTGDMNRCMEINLWSRTATRILYQVASGQANHLQALYDQLVEIPWEEWIPDDGYLTVDGVIRHRSIRDFRIANQKTKDAVVDRIRAKKGQRPNSGGDRTGSCVYLHWTDEGWSVYIDTTGEPLGRRGYRANAWKAPLPETLAAGLLLSSGYDGTQSLVNPFCGSGTFIIEGALIAGNIAPGLGRHYYAFQHLIGYDEPSWRQMRAEAKQQVKPQEEWPSLMASDLDIEAISQAKSNAKKAGVVEAILFDTHDFSEQDLPVSPGFIALNPPYGMRLGDPDLVKRLFKRIGSWIRKETTDWDVGVLMEDPWLVKPLGRGKSAHWINGKLDLCWWVKDDDAEDQEPLSFGRGERRSSDRPSGDRDKGSSDVEDDLRPRTRVAIYGQDDRRDDRRGGDDRRGSNDRSDRERDYRASERGSSGRGNKRHNVPPFKKRQDERRKKRPDSDS